MHRWALGPVLLAGVVACDGSAPSNPTFQASTRILMIPSGARASVDIVVSAAEYHDWPVRMTPVVLPTGVLMDPPFVDFSSDQQSATVWFVAPLTAGTAHLSFSDQKGHQSFNVLTIVVGSGSGGGELDPTFGVLGRATVNPVRDLLVLPETSVVIGGATASVPTLTRLTAAGRPDATFGSNGALALPRAGGTGGAVEKTLLGPGGELYAAGTVDGGSGTPVRTVVWRVLADGSIDASFGSAGLAEITSAQPPCCTVSLALESDGHVRVATSTASGELTSARLDGAGVLDPTYGNSGLVTATLGITVTAMIPRGDLGWFAAGYSGAPQAKLLSITPQGAVDPAFTAVDVASPPSGYQLLSLSEGKLVAVGVFGSYSKVVRYLPSGQLDPSFSSIGFISNGDELKATAVMPDGRILLLVTFAGLPWEGTLSRSRVLRFQSDGRQDVVFGNFGDVDLGSRYAPSAAFGLAESGVVYVSYPNSLTDWWLERRLP